MLGVLAGRDRERFVNRYLARRLARLLATSSSVLDIRYSVLYTFYCTILL